MEETNDKSRCKKVKWSCYRPGVAQRVGRGIALLFLDRACRRGWVVSSTPRPHFTPGKDPVPILQKAKSRRRWYKIDYEGLDWIKLVRDGGRKAYFSSNLYLFYETLWLQCVAYRVLYESATACLNIKRLETAVTQFCFCFSEGKEITRLKLNWCVFVMETRCFFFPVR